MASFQDKIVWKKPRKRGIKNYRFVPFVSNVLQIIPNKFKKQKKYHYGFISSQNRLKADEKERK